MLFGLFVWLAPFVLVVLAWAWFRNNSRSLVEWRRFCLSLAIILCAINSSLVVALFLLTLVNHGESGSGMIEATGILLSALVFILGLFGAGRARVYVLLATLCTLFLWHHNL